MNYFQALHKATLDIDEKGTTAAAATTVLFRPMFASPLKTLTFDRPFMIFITDQKNDNILFFGKVVNPTEKQWCGNQDVISTFASRWTWFNNFWRYFVECTACWYTKVLNPPPRFIFLQSLVPKLIKHLNQLIKLFGFSRLEINCRKENLQYHRQAFLDLFALVSVLSVKWQMLYVMLDQKKALKNIK